MSASCSNIATNQIKKQKNSFRSSLRRKGSGRGFLPEQRPSVANQERVEGVASSQRSTGDVTILASSPRGVERVASQASVENLGLVRGAGQQKGPPGPGPRGVGQTPGPGPNLQANGNTNNTNSNAVSSPRASATSSPSNHITDAPPQMASNASSRVNINALSGSSALSQPSGSNPNMAMSSQVSMSASSLSNSVSSSRAAARRRAETRRESLLSTHTSSEEDEDRNEGVAVTNQGPGLARTKRRRSQASGSSVVVVGQRSPLESGNQVADEVVVVGRGPGEERELSQTLRAEEGVAERGGVCLESVVTVGASQERMDGERETATGEQSGKCVTLTPPIYIVL